MKERCQVKITEEVNFRRNFSLRIYLFHFIQVTISLIINLPVIHETKVLNLMHMWWPHLSVTCCTVIWQALCSVAKHAGNKVIQMWFQHGWHTDLLYCHLVWYIPSFKTLHPCWCSVASNFLPNHKAADIVFNLTERWCFKNCSVMHKLLIS